MRFINGDELMGHWQPQSIINENQLEIEEEIVNGSAAEGTHTTSSIAKKVLSRLIHMRCFVDRYFFKI